MEAPGFEGVMVLRLRLGTLRRGPSLLRKFRAGNWGIYSLFQGRLQHIWDARIMEQPPRTAADMEWSDLSLWEKPYISVEDRAKNGELSSPFGGRKIMSLRHWELNNLRCWNWFYLILTVPWFFSWNKKVFLMFFLFFLQELAVNKLDFKRGFRFTSFEIFKDCGIFETWIVFYVVMLVLTWDLGHEPEEKVTVW